MVRCVRMICVCNKFWNRSYSAQLVDLRTSDVSIDYILDPGVSADLELCTVTLRVDFVFG